MSDYMFMLESHLTGEQHKVVGQMQAAAAEAGFSLYLTGGAMRDVLGGFPVRDLDFVTEGNPAKLAALLDKRYGAKITSKDDKKKSVMLLFPGHLQVELAMARQEHYSKSGAKPKITPATIHEDLHGRDFTINAIALSLNHASLGLLIDPTNGVGDIERKELRTIHNYSFYDDPSRILRLMRFKTRLGYQIEQRTQMQLENAREAEILKKIDPDALSAELRAMAAEQQPADLLKTLEEQGLLALYSPALAGVKLNLAGFTKLQKAYQLIPFGGDFSVNYLSLFLDLLTGKLNPKEKAAFVKAAGLQRSELNAAQKLPGEAKKFEKALKGPKLQKPSLLYQLISKTPGEQTIYVAVHSEARLVQDRIKNYSQKYLPMAEEVTDEVVAAAPAAANLTPGSPKFLKVKEAMTLTKLDARPKKVVPVEPPPPPPPQSGFVRGAGLRRAPA